MNKALKSLRSKKLLTQEDVAKKLNVARQTYSNWENNVGSLTLNQVFKLFIVLEATPEEQKEFFYTIQMDKKSNE